MPYAAAGSFSQPVHRKRKNSLSSCFQNNVESSIFSSFHSSDLYLQFIIINSGADPGHEEKLTRDIASLYENKVSVFLEKRKISLELLNH